MRAYPPPKFHVSSVSGSRDSRGGRICPPSKARNSQTLSRGRVNQDPIANECMWLKTQKHFVTIFLTSSTLSQNSYEFPAVLTFYLKKNDILTIMHSSKCKKKRYLVGIDILLITTRGLHTIEICQIIRLH